MTTGTTTLILAVHAHQPVGNFGWVFGEAYTKAYRPFLDVIERHPTLKWTLHLSGPLVDWLAEEHPEFLQRVAALVKRGQAEVMGGGYAEPILALIPERDAVGQLTRFTRQLAAHRLGPCRGAWLAERVWEPSLPRLFRAAGLDYTIVDDHHLTLAGAGADAAFGYWMTEDAGATLALFPSSKALRYLIPFHPVAEVLEHLKAQRGPAGRAVILADDWEKFGLWPGTAGWVYEEGWLESFCRVLEGARDWLTTYTVSQYQSAYPPLGRIYVPCASYEEMAHWSGGYFRNFLTKYPEANTLHKKMLWVSNYLHTVEARGKGRGATPRLLREAETHLYRGQDNDAYWHGVFGGIYLHHLRAAAYRELLTAEQLVDRVVRGARPWTAAEANDFDGDGRPELLLRSGVMDVLVDPARGGTIVEWDEKTRPVNLVNTLSRRPEPYHTALREPAMAQAAATAEGSGGPATIHAGVRVKDPAATEPLVYDRYRRVAAMDHLWPAGTGDAQAFAQGTLPAGAFLEQPYRWRFSPARDGVQAILQREGAVGPAGGRATMVRVTKAVTVARRRPCLTVTYTILNLGAMSVSLRIGTEWNLALKDPHFNRIGTLHDARRLVLTDVHADLRVELEVSSPAACWYAPVETVSDSEAGVERTYQQLSLLLWWDVTAAPRRPWRVTLTQTVLAGGLRAAV